MTTSTPDAKTVLLEDHEKLALCGLARVLLQSDAGLSAPEYEALSAVLDEVFAPAPTAAPGDVPYRTPPDFETPRVDVDAWMERAGKELPDEAAVRKAALTVTRPEARQVLCDALFSLAATDTVSDAEWAVLDWLTDSWGMPSMRS